MPSPGKTSLTLLTRIAQSQEDPAAWSDFVKAYGVHVLDWCRSYGLRETDALDLTQDVLVRFWRQAAQFRYDPSRRFRGYLRALTHAAWADWCENLVPGGIGQGGNNMLTVLHDIPARDELVDCLERAYETELYQLAAEDVKNRVEPHTWQAFQMMTIERRPGSEVASILGMKLNTVHVARRKVQEMIKDKISTLEENISFP